MSARSRRVTGVLTLVVLVALLAAACSSQKTSQLVGPTWQLASISEKTPMYEASIPPDQQASYTITFKDDGTAAIKADCNNVNATWKEGSGAGLTITPGAATLVSCGADSQGDRFVAGLAKTVSYGVSGGTLKLTQNDGSQLTLTAP
jgi:heat shock protein HslJ